VFEAPSVELASLRGKYIYRRERERERERGIGESRFESTKQPKAHINRNNQKHTSIAT
jgi:hypothetical protein